MNNTETQGTIQVLVFVCARIGSASPRTTDCGAIHPSSLSYLLLAKQIQEIPNHSNFVSIHLLGRPELARWLQDQRSSPGVLGLDSTQKKSPVKTF